MKNYRKNLLKYLFVLRKPSMLYIIKKAIKKDHQYCMMLFEISMTFALVFGLEIFVLTKFLLVPIKSISFNPWFIVICDAFIAALLMANLSKNSCIDDIDHH